MLTNKFYSVLRPFFNSRWGSELANNDMLDSYVNIAIQDIYNRHHWWFRNIFEKLDTSTDLWNWTRRFNTSYPISSIVDIYDQDWNPVSFWYSPINSWDTNDEFTETDANIWENFIIVRNDIEYLDIRYIRWFQWFTYNDAKNLPLPLPDKFVPPLLLLIYDYASPISYFEDDAQIPRYEIAEKQLTYIKNNDSLSESMYLAPDKSI